MKSNLVKSKARVKEFGEVYTPPKVVEMMLDHVPLDVWNDPTKTFLEPACGNGNIVVAIIRRKMLHGSTLEQALLTTFGVDIQPDNVDECRSRIISEFSVSENLHDVVYQNIVCKNFLKDDGDVKYDVIISNPPYQKMDQAEDSKNKNKISASPIYPDFHEKSEKLDASHIIMIIPAKALQGGKGLSDFRKNVLKGGHTKSIQIHECSTKEWFNGNGPSDGHIIYHWNKHYNNNMIRFHNLVNNFTTSIDVNKYGEIFLRDYRCEPIIDKVLVSGNLQRVYSRKPFALPTNHFKVYGSKPFALRTNHFKIEGYVDPNPEDETVQCCWNNGENKGDLNFRSVRLSDVKKNVDLIGKWKVITAKAGSNDKNDSLKRDVGTGNIFILKPGQICTETYLLLHVFGSFEESLNFKKFMHSELAQFMISMKKSTQDVVTALDWLPELDWSIEWTNQKLYDHFKLNEQEILLVKDVVSKTMKRHERYR